MHRSSEVTRLLLQWNEGEEQARDALVPLLYDEMRAMAHARVRRERGSHTLGTTDLVHEAYLKIADLTEVQWNDRKHFLALLSRIMRHILIDYARARNAARRGGNYQRVELDEERLLPDEQIETVLELEEALERMEQQHPRPAQAVAHCYFGGLTNEEAADVLDISRATVERDLRFARAWLARELTHDVQLDAQRSVGPSP